MAYEPAQLPHYTEFIHWSSKLIGFMKTHLVAQHTVYVYKINNGGKFCGKRGVKDVRVFAKECVC